MKTMRTLHLYISLSLLALLAALTACVGEELSRPEGKGVGYLRLSLGDISATVSAGVETKAGSTTLPDSYLPAPADFMIDIKKNGVSEEGYPRPFSEVEGKPLELFTSIYTVEVYTEKNELIQAEPYFYGSKEVRIIPGVSSEESIETSLANAMLEVAVSENLQKHYQTWKLTVKVGEASEVLATGETPKGTLFVRSGEAVKASFEGTNLLGNPANKEWEMIAQTEARKQYVVQCDPDLLIFSKIEMQALATPTYEGDLLTGSKVTLGCIAEGVPVELVDTWTVNVLYNDTPIRTYSSNNLSGAMTVVEGWPYVPKGCKLSTSIKLRTGEEIPLSPVDVAVIEPNFFVSDISARTSYSAYLENDIAGANAMDGSSIVDIKATASIAETILNNPNYSNLLKSSYKMDTGQESGELAYTDTTSFTPLAWQKHVLTARVTFDGTAKESSKDCDVTGLPYRAEPPRNTGEHPWRIIQNGTANYIKFENNYVLLKSDGSDPIVGSSPFYIPTNISFKLHSKYKKNGSRNTAYEYEVNLLSGNTRGSRICFKDAKEVQEHIVEGTQTFTSEYNAVSCRFESKTLLGTDANLIYVYIDYN